MCHGLWNNAPLVVAYNRELLSLGAQLANSQISDEFHMFTFNFEDKKTGRGILAGNLAKCGAFPCVRIGI